ncbi:ATP-binding protein [Streptomyces sp. NBC_01506]|uniref:ATP-binding protein n=1 Tax=Streptomyces sp. NBC_01506 TaxID=2903887 RepID=UPI003862E5F0
MTTTAVRQSQAVLSRDRDVMNERIQVQPRPAGVQPSREDACRVGAMRRIAAARLRYCGLAALIDEVTLVVSELVTNAVLHTRTSEVRVTIAVLDGFLVVTVIDGMPGLATPRRADEVAESGRGLTLVAVVAEEHGGDWGTNDTGTETWCRLALPAERRP